MADAFLPGDRLDSWKAIADYLQRDVATVRRWEKALGLPVRRVAGGPGRSVFAYPSEIDAWLRTSPGGPAVAVVVPAPIPAPVPPPVALSDRRRHLGTGIAVAAVLLLAGAVTWVRGTSMPAMGDLQVEATPTGITARDADGNELWRHPFPAGYDTVLSGNSFGSQVMTDGEPSVYAITAYRERRSDRQIESGELLAFDARGQVLRTFAFDDELRYGEEAFGPPWAITAFSAEAAGARRVAVASHHWLWSPSLLTVLDANGRRRGTFANYGWIEQVRWLTADRLLFAGYSEPLRGGMVALLDPAALPGQGPVARDSRFYCEACGDGRPLAMAVLPRSEVNEASLSRFNRAIIEVTASSILARSIEMPPDASGVIDVLYEFTHDLELVRASFGERYWEAHRLLEAQGKITHTREACPDRDGPRRFHRFTAATGWRELTIR